MRSDPNGYDWEALGYSSLEAFIESKAGACPPKTAAFRRQLAFDKLVEHPWEKHDFPMPEPPPFAADDENDEAPNADESGVPTPPDWLDSGDE